MHYPVLRIVRPWQAEKFSVRIQQIVMVLSEITKYLLSKKVYASPWYYYHHAMKKAIIIDLNSIKIKAVVCSVLVGVGVYPTPKSPKSQLLLLACSAFILI